jgi:molybdenum cofactor cytidylyltransferase
MAAAGSMEITGVVLAAGLSLRMRQNKLLMKFKQQTVLEETLRQMLSSRVRDILVITGFERDRAEEVISRLRSTRITTVYNRDYGLGRAESVKCAVRHVKGEADAVLFMVADKPGVTGSLINRAISRFEKEAPDILYVRTPAGRGHPIVFSKKLFNELLSLNGDFVGDDLIARHGDNVVALDDETVQVDIDTEEDYRAAIESVDTREIRQR